MKTKKMKIRFVFIFVGIILIICSMYFTMRYFKSSKYLYEKISLPNIIVSKEVLVNDLKIISDIEGVGTQITLLSNEKVMNQWPKEAFLQTNGKLIEGNVIHVAIMNEAFVDSKKPVELRFIIRTMLYLKEKNFDIAVGNIIGISGGFARNPIETFEGDQLIKMSVEEFDDLKKEADVTNNTVDKQVDILTDQWIKKTGYWRRGLFGKEER